MMDHRLRMDIRRGYAAEDSLDFGSQQASCPPSARSFSSASSSDPYTPTSGRSTPQQAPGPMANFDPVVCSSSSMAYELTPPASDLESYFPLEIKSEYPPTVSNCTAMMRTAVEKYEPAMNMALRHQMPDALWHDMYSEPPNSQPLGQYMFPVQHMRPSPTDVSTGSFMLPSSEFDAFPAWHGEHENFHPDGDFYPRPAAPMVPVEQLDVSMPDKSPRSSGSVASSGRKRRIKQVQQKTKNLRRAQSRHAEHSEMEVHGEDWDEVECNFHLAEKAQHFCQFMGCNKSFRRLEHLKRHHDTVHFRFKLWECEFCPVQKGPKVFNRFDNYVSHVNLHNKRSSNSAKRTNYHPAAAAHLAILEAQMKVRTKKRPARASPGAATPATTTTAPSTPSRTTKSPGAAAEKKKKASPSPSSSSDVYTPGSNSSSSSRIEEAAPLTAACQGLRRLGLGSSASPAV